MDILISEALFGLKVLKGQVFLSEYYFHTNGKELSNQKVKVNNEHIVFLY